MEAHAPTATGDTYPPAEAGAVVAGYDDGRCMVRRCSHVV